MTIDLIIEQGKYSTWGRVHYDGNLIIEEAANEQEIITSMKSLLNAFHGVDPLDVDFNIQYENHV